MKKLFTFLSLMLFVLVGYGQTTTIDFETAGSGYTPSTTFGSGNSDAFNRTNTSVNGNSTYHWVAEDINGNPSITLDQISVSGAASFTFAVDFSYPNSAKWDATDELIITYSIDGGSYSNLMAVQHINSDAYNNPAALDLDFDGNGDVGHELSTSSFVTYTTSSISLSSNSTLDIKFQFNNLTSNGEGIFIDNIVITQTPASTNSSASDIIKTSTFSEPTNIDYTAYSAASSLTTGNSIEVASFTIRDGGTTTDGDAVGTNLSALSVDVTNYFDLEALAVFDGTTNVAEVTGISGAGSGTVSFTGLAINTTDGGTKDFTLRATFSTTVTDNDNIKYTISSATADASGSDFAASDAGAASTDDTGDNNKIAVTADRFQFMLNQTNVTVGQDFMVDINAVDVNDNLDFDATPSVTIARGSTGTGTITSATGVTQSMVGGFIEYTDVQYDVIEDFTIAASASGYTTTTSGTFTASGNFESTIVKKSGWSEPTNIDYTAYTAASSLTTSNAKEIAKFTIQDGGDDNTDDDNVSTKMTDLDITVGNWENIKALAIFEGTTNKGEVSVASGSVSFSSITGGIEAADESTKDFSIYATFNTSVTDNQNIQITIATPTADASGSTFDAGASNASTDNTGDNNKIVVTASTLTFTANKPGSSVTKSTDFEVEVKAVDANDNVDLDMIDPVTLSEGSGTGTLSSATGLTQNLVSGAYNWTDVQYDVAEDFTIAASVTGLTTAITGTITCGAALKAWINEFHYDNDGTDADEMVEICIQDRGAASLSNFTVSLYNGANGAVYDTKTLDAFTEGTTYDHVVVYSYNYTTNGYSIQNGAPDGIAISYDDGAKGVTVFEFISYEGNFTATDGPANGTASNDIGVSESASTLLGTSIGRTGMNDADSWEAGNTATAGTENNTSSGTQTLPVKLLSFNAIAENDAVIIKWQTASEENNDYFSVERSYNANDFEEIAQIQGAGNSNQIQNYKFIDLNADINKSVYFRLKQTDYNGVYTYSDIVAVNAPSQGFKLSKSYSIDGELNLEINSNFNTHSQMQLMDITGKILYSKSLNIEKGLHNYRIRLANYASGIYFLRIITENGLYVQDKLILQ